MNLTLSNAEEIGTPIFDNIISAHISGDYEQLIRNFSLELKDAIPEPKFLSARDEAIIPFGRLISTQYLGCLERKDAIFQLLWKVKYEKGEEEILWQLYIVQVEEGIEVQGLWFG